MALDLFEKQYALIVNEFGVHAPRARAIKVQPPPASLPPHRKG